MSRPTAGLGAGASALRRPAGRQLMPDGSPAVLLTQDALCQECRRVLRAGTSVRGLREFGGMGGWAPTVFCSTECRTLYIEETP